MDATSKVLFDMMTDINRVYVSGLEAGKKIQHTDKNQEELAEQMEAEKKTIISHLDGIQDFINNLSCNDDCVIIVERIDKIIDFIQRRA